jgi:carboxypeptidase C (cathepsin A)
MDEALDAILWSGHARFKFEKLQPWYFTDEKGSLVNGGTYKYANGLGIINIREAGHMSPHDQPVGTMQVMKKWLAGEPF